MSTLHLHPMPEATEHYVEEPAAMTTATPLAFAVRRGKPVLVGPASPTPCETKRLSDNDDQGTLRGHVPFLLLYRGGGGASAADARDPADVIRRALGEALVPYYPLAGRLREVEGRKLVVDCTGEGVMFVEADADVRLAELEAASPGGLMPPFPCVDQLLFDVDGSGGVLNRPMLFIQVTRLLCGGFILAFQLNHTICDATGVAQFMSATAELARGLPAPTVAPVWSRELLDARSPPRPSFPHCEFDAVPARAMPAGDMILRTFTFGPADVTAIKRGLPPSLRDTATTFETLTGALWRARTAVLELPADEEVRLVSVVGFRGVPELALPAGFYGNGCVAVGAVTTAGALLGGSLGDAVEIVRQTKAAVTAEYVRSSVDLLVLRGRPGVALGNLFLVSDNRHSGIHRVDFGWGEPVYAGPAGTLFGYSLVVHVGNGGGGGDGKGKGKVGVLIMLPRPAMDRFASEVEKLLKN